jgi:tagatose 1,6-diphosphate aldolase
MDTKIFTENGRYLMFAFDHRGSFKKFIDPEDPENVTREQAANHKKKLINSIKDQFSGILIDPEFGLDAYKSLDIQKPFLLPAEETGYETVNEEKVNVLVNKASELKELGASGVKVLIYFNPDLQTAKQQLYTSKKILKDAHENGMPLFLEIVTYDMGDEEKVLRSVEYFVENDVIPDVFKIEFPGSDYLCQKVTNILGITPWIMLTRAVDYTLFKEQLSMACDNGCRGFLAGRSLWQEYFDIIDPIKVDEFLSNTLPSRFTEISKIATSL